MSCQFCRDFEADPAALETALAGLSALSSALASTRNGDGHCRRHDRLLRRTASCAAFAPAEARAVPMVHTLRDVWRVHYGRDGDGRPRWRSAAELPPVGERLQSPYDPEMHYSTKRQMEWSGYKVHVTETCDEDAAHLVTHVRACPAMEQDMTSTAEIHQRPEYEALNAARARMDDPAWKRRYRIRAGIESTLSQDVRAFGMRRSRYIGLAKTGLQQVCTAAAMNVSRVVNWLDGAPRAKTRVTRFATLAQAT